MHFNAVWNHSLAMNDIRRKQQILHRILMLQQMFLQLIRINLFAETFNITFLPWYILFFTLIACELEIHIHIFRKISIVIEKDVLFRSS